MAPHETRVLFRNIDEPGLADIDTYRRLGGYTAIENTISEESRTSAATSGFPRLSATYAFVSRRRLTPTDPCRSVRNL